MAAEEPGGRGEPAAHGEPAVHADGLVRSFGAHRVLDHVELRVERGEFFSLLGPSGCGKTTALRIIAGLEEADEGRVRIDGADVSRVPAHRRPTNLVFQQGALFPHMDVARNVAFGLKAEHTGREETARRVAEVLDVVGMGAFAGRAPSTLSGGQRQRVAIARALVKRPRVLLLDEPLSALDLGLQLRMRRELRALQRRTATTFVCVTHNQAEAMEMSDRIAVMARGRIEQIGTAEELYRTPVSRFVAEFIGENNLFTVTGTEPGPAGATPAGPARYAVAAADGLRLPLPGDTGAAPDTVAAVRPESFRITPPDSPDAAVRAVVRSAGFLGARVRVVLETSEGREILADTSGTGTIPAVGESVGLAVDASDVVVLPGTGPGSPR
ncbi:ABC transporter ATP-binding protein [Streptomyces paludis]|uniref:ABC transporter ATP-binding protein n=1 Tax=Streptomyces paludis TaxID=2282738 RepID=UPI001E46107B|nr:ABC transporter ATP-binding protein [Streptomyces paludis]